MQSVFDALADQHAELAGMLRGLTDDDWRRPSRCDGWTVADVVLHLAQTDEMAIASAQGTFSDALRRFTEGMAGAGSVDDGADQLVAREREQPAEDICRRWEAGTERLRDAFAACDPHARLTWVAGELSATTLATTRLAETWIHTGDVAAAFGMSPAPTERLWHIARLAWRTLPYAFARAGRALGGPVAFELRGPGGEQWNFVPEAPVHTRIGGDAVDLCLVAGRRVDASQTTLEGDGPDAAAVLELVRTYA